MLTFWPHIISELGGVRSISSLLRIDRPKPIWDGNVENKNGKISKMRQGFFKFWNNRIPKGITRYQMKADWCYSHYNWTPGRYISTVNPDRLNYTQKWGVKNPYPMGPCWRLHTNCIELTSNDRQTDPDKAVSYTHLTLPTSELV